MNLNGDTYFNKLVTWKAELFALRSILLDCQLTENIKWQTPCYSNKNANIALLAKFKNYCAISFFKGVLLKDEYRILLAPGENSQSVRMVKFTTLSEILVKKEILKAYIFEAIELEKAGVKVELKKAEDFKLPLELEQSFIKYPEFKNSFFALTPGRQRGYLLYFESAKQSSTKLNRIDKYKERIVKGFGIHDCVCGLSKKMPNCDGSHKFIKKS